MTLTEAVIIINRMQEKVIVGNTPDVDTFTKLDFIKRQIIESQKPKKRKWPKAS